MDTSVFLITKYVCSLWWLQTSDAMAAMDLWGWREVVVGFVGVWVCALAKVKLL